MAKKKSLFTYKKGRKPSNTSYYKNLQKMAKEARESKFLRSVSVEKVDNFKEALREYEDQHSEKKYKGDKAHTKYTKIMDRIPEDEREKYRSIASNEDFFYWGDYILKLDFETVDEAYKKVEKERKEIAKANAEKDPEEPLLPH